jgi:SAM-dependent methyltransferase
MASAVQVSRPEPVGDVQSLTLTERLGLTTRWGRYLTGLEHDAISMALRTFSVPGEALEVGCQGGRWVEMLAGNGWRVACTDVDEIALRACQVRTPSAKCILVSSHDRTIPAADASADLLLCIEIVPVIHSDWFPAEAQRVLRPGGALVSVILNRRSLRGLFVLIREKLGLARPYKDAPFLYTRSYKPWKRQMQRLAFQFEFERGCCWFPFSRQSDSALIPVSIATERGLGLHRLTSLSPWVVFVARKTNPN